MKLDHMGLRRPVLRRDLLASMAAGVLAGSISQTAIAAGTARYPRLKRGINVHHVLNWPEVRTGANGPEYVWPPFKPAHYTFNAKQADLIHRLGFDFIRLTVDPGLLIASDGARWPDMRSHFISVVEGMIGSGLSVIFDLAPVRNHPAYRPDLLVQREDSPLFMSYAAMITRVATALRDLPSDRIILELFNEPPLDRPADYPRWQRMLERLHTSARAGAPDLALLLAGAAWDDRTTMMGLDLSAFRSSNVLYTFHYYDPHLFTHQGVDADDTRFIAGLSWPMTPESRSAVLDRASRLIAAKTPQGASAQTSEDRVLREIKKLDQDTFTEARVARDFAEIAKWAAANDISHDRVVVGEFGCVISSDGVPTGKSRIDWLRTVRTAAEAAGFPWAYWALKGYGGMELVDANDTFHEDLVEPLGLNRPR